MRLSGGPRPWASRVHDVARGVRIEPFDLLAHVEEADAVKRAALATVVEATGVGGDDGEQHYERHAARDGFRAVGAFADDRLVGFGYGYLAARGSWWDAWVRPALEAVAEDHLLDGAFEVVTLHVAPARHREGVGKGVLTALLDGVTCPRALLTTQDGANPARGFYAHLGFREVAHLTYGADVPYLVLARDLPWQRIYR
jgi:GNAT superfamily N-acetyltransferase